MAGPLGEMPASVAATLLGAEILLHGWDLTEALGRTVTVSDADASPLDGFAAFAGRHKLAGVTG